MDSLNLGGALASIGGAAISGITFDSAAVRGVEIDSPGASSSADAQAGSTSDSSQPFLVRLLRPVITIHLATGDSVRIAPAGDAPAFPYLAPVGVLILALAAYGAFRLVRR